MKKKLTILMGIVLGYFATDLMSCNSDTTITQPTFADHVDTIKTIQKDTFVLNEKSVYYMICDADIKYPKIVLKQAILESGHFNSDLCKYNHNIFGFSGCDGYFSYNTYQESVNHYKMWQDINYKSGNYYDFLVKVKYDSEDSSYIETLKKIKINV